MSFLNKLKQRWQISSNWQLFMICVVFAITGSSSAMVSAPILKFLNITKELHPAIFWPLRILIIFPVYQVLLIIIGTLLGQFKFFWAFEKKMLSRFGLNLK
jgi:hypothetical protein